MSGQTHSVVSSKVPTKLKAKLLAACDRRGMTQSRYLHNLLKRAMEIEAQAVAAESADEAGGGS